MEKLFGIDISHWQGDFNIEQARNERGVKFVIAKAAGADAESIRTANLKITMHSARLSECRSERTITAMQSQLRKQRQRQNISCQQSQENSSSSRYTMMSRVIC